MTKSISFKVSILSIFLSALFSPFLTSAGTSDNLSGWAWSSNVGWISFNCTNTSSCGTVNYGVNKDVSGNLAGYAWSSNIGWIQFGGLSSFPSGGGTQGLNAVMQGSNLVGWVRALSYSGDWDGWISLSGSLYGVSLSSNSYTGYAWGSTVVGWVSFDIAGSDGVKLGGNVNLDAKIAGSSIVSATVPFLSIVNLEYTLSDMGGNTCNLSKISAGGTPFATVSGITVSGTSDTDSMVTGSYSFELNCTNGLVKSVSFNVGTEPQGATIGSDESLSIKFPQTGPADSEIKTITINPVGGFIGNVDVSITSSPSLPNGATILYSFNGGAFSTNPTVSIPYNGSATFRARVSKKVSETYNIVLTGTAAGIPDTTKTYILTPEAFSPKFEEY
jgi:hypothetical protein